jgi:2-C-methyl-D-erythritol 4-phosphate cytidylyltransferase
MTAGPQRLRTVGVVLAGGTGTRVGLNIPKQLLRIAGRPIIEHTIAALEAAPEIDEIIVLMAAGFTEDVDRTVRSGGYRKVSRVIEGGASRNETTRRALDALGDSECNVLLHDAVRPLLSQRIIRECVNELRHYEAVDVAIPSADTIITVDGDIITGIPERSRLRRGQTPQGFRLSTIRRAYACAQQDEHFTATDDCSILLRYLPDVPIKVVEGSEQNMKVTHPVDVFLADKLFQLASGLVARPTSPQAYAEQLRGRTAVVFGGSCGIGGDIVELLSGFGADVFSFSRSETGSNIEDPDHVSAALAEAYERTGRIDFVVNTAGLLRTGALAGTDEATVLEMIGVNYIGPVTIARQSFRYLQETHGHLVLFTSSSYTRGRAGYSLYSSSKAAIVNLAQALGDEWAAVGVRVSCINPERTATPMRTGAFGPEPPETLLSSRVVALTTIDVLLSESTGQVIDVRRVDPGQVIDVRRVDPSEVGTLGKEEGDLIGRFVAEAEAEAEAEAALEHRTPWPSPRQ